MGVCVRMCLNRGTCDHMQVSAQCVHSWTLFVCFPLSLRARVCSVHDGVCVLLCDM